MIDMSVVLGWLNALGNTSHLNNEARRRIRELPWPTPSDDDVNVLLERLRSAAQSSNNPLETAELLLHCAAIAHWRRWFPQSARYAHAAVTSYENDDHRRAIALWIRGIVEWETLHNHDAFTSWAEARKIFRKRQIIFQHCPDESEWYQHKIWEMNVECAARPEEIMTWLNLFEESSLRCSSQAVVTYVREKIRQHAYRNIYVLTQDLQEAIRRSEEAYERAEVYLEFGLALYQLGNIHSAMNLLRKAVELFHTGIRCDHKQVVARCMLGAMEWKQKSSHHQAFVHWVRSIEEFEQLRWWADRDNMQEKEHWFAEHRALLRVALSERLPHQYQDLVFLLHGDLDEANRRIELERQQFPHEDFSKLIDRALEHVLLGGR
jgi:tetratricopeptide (TPR) repeat protein